MDPPENALPFEQAGYVQMPAYLAAAVEVCAYTVPQGHHAVFKWFVTRYDGQAQFVQGSGDIVWSIDVNRPVGGALLSGYTLADYSNILNERGDNGQPWALSPPGLRFKENDTLRIKVRTVQNVSTGVAGFSTGILMGWIWPR
jgi:hypothetical protein